MKKILMFVALILLLIVSVVFTASYFMVANAENYTNENGQFKITFERSDWTSLVNTDSNPLGSFSGTYEKIEVGLHSDGLQISFDVSENFLIGVGYSSGKMNWGNNINFSIGVSQEDLPHGTIWTAEPNKEYSIQTNYKLAVSNSNYNFPFQINFKYVNVDETTINLNYEIVYSYLYMQGNAQYGVALPKVLNFTFLGLESNQVRFNYINSEFGTSSTTRVYNVGSSFGVLPEIPYLPDYAIDYYWAYAGSLDTPLNTESTVENKQIYAVYSVDMSLLSTDVLNKLQRYYTNGYDKGFSEGVAQNGILEKPLEMWGGFFSKIGTFFDIELLPNITLGTLILIPIAFAVLLVILKLIRG